MRTYKLFLSLFLVCVLSFGISLPALAVDLDFSQLQAQSLFYLQCNDRNDNNSPIIEELIGGVYVFENTSTQQTHTAEEPKVEQLFDDPYLQHRLIVEMSDGGAVLHKGDTARIIVQRIAYELTVQTTTGLPAFNGSSTATQFMDESSLERCNIRYLYADGSFSEYQTLVLGESVYCDGTYFYYDFEVTADKPINRIFILSYFDQEYFTDMSFIKVTAYAEANPFLVTGEMPDEKEGLLSGILAFVKSIKEKVDGTFDLIKELPSKLWQVMENGIKGLFIPSEQFMIDNSDRWQSLLDDRLGAVAQVGDIVFDSWDDIKNYDEQNTIYIPEVSLESAGIPYSFGDYVVSIVPSGFEILVEILKKIISILCTIAFVNGLLKRYDEVMGVER